MPWRRGRSLALQTVKILQAAKCLQPARQTTCRRPILRGGFSKRALATSPSTSLPLNSMRKIEQGAA